MDQRMEADRRGQCVPDLDVVAELPPSRSGEVPRKDAPRTGRVDKGRPAKEMSLRSISRMIHALNLQARYDLGSRHGKP